MKDHITDSWRLFSLFKGSGVQNTVNRRRGSPGGAARPTGPGVPHQGRYCPCTCADCSQHLFIVHCAPRPFKAFCLVMSCRCICVIAALLCVWKSILACSVCTHAAPISFITRAIVCQYRLTALSLRGALAHFVLERLLDAHYAVST